MLLKQEDLCFIYREIQNDYDVQQQQLSSPTAHKFVTPVVTMIIIFGWSNTPFI